MKKIISNFCVLFLLLLLSGCATIFSGWKQRIKVESNPSIATVYIDDVEVGKTPFSTKLLRRKEHVLKIKMEGYQDYQIKLTKKVNLWVFANIAVGGAVGALVDLSTGAIYRLSPKQIKAEMNKGTVFRSDKHNLYIAVSLTADSTLEKIGQMQAL